MQSARSTLGVLVLFSSLLRTACLSRPEVRSVGPGEVSGDTRLGSIAVLPFEGPYGHMIANRIGYELLQRGYGIVPQDRVRALLASEGVTIGDLYRDPERARVLELARRLGADTVLVGSVLPRGEPDSRIRRVADEFRPAAPLKVRFARADLVRVADGQVLGAATFQGEREFGVFTPNYRDAARGLVQGMLGD